MRPVFLFLLLAAASAAPLAAKGGKPRMVAVMPDVVGQTVPEAQRQLRGANLAVKVVEEASAKVGRVLSQRPAPGAAVDPGSIAVIHIGVKADVPTVMPRLIGRDIDEVRRRYAAIYVLDIVAVEDASAGRPGIVLKQHPAPGTKHPFRGRVRIELVARPSVVPDLVGKSEAVARTLVTGAGLQWVVTKEVRAGVLPGSVLSQDPPAHVAAAPGTVVRLVVSGGSEPVRPIPRGLPELATRAQPDLVGLPFHAAHLWARTLGFMPQATFVRRDDTPDLHVVTQHVAKGSPVREGSAVAFTVARGTTPARDLPIPMLLGYHRDDAKRILEGLGYRARVASRPSPLAPGTVVEQLPRAGRPAAQGSDLVLFVAQPPPPTWKAAEVKLPAFTKRRIEDALVYLYRLNFQVRLQALPAERVHEDLVVQQDPPVGAGLRMGQTVVLGVPERVRVPNVVGLAADEARAVLQRAGLLSAPVEGQGIFFVVRQEPAPLRVVARNTAMRLQIAWPVVLPDLRGLDVETARQTLKSLGLELRVMDTADGQIRSQEPAPGQRVAPGSTVDVHVGP